MLELERPNQVDEKERRSGRKHVSRSSFQIEINGDAGFGVARREPWLGCPLGKWIRRFVGPGRHEKRALAGDEDLAIGWLGLLFAA